MFGHGFPHLEREWFTTSRPDFRAWERTSLFGEGKNHPELYKQPKPISKLGKV